MCISLLSYGRPVVRCMGVGLDMGWVGSWVHKFTWQWVGLGQLFGGLGWVDENRPTDNSVIPYGRIYEFAKIWVEGEAGNLLP